MALILVKSDPTKSFTLMPLNFWNGSKYAFF
jgi:hypothetical protein